MDTLTVLNLVDYLAQMLDLTTVENLVHDRVESTDKLTVVETETMSVPLLVAKWACTMVL